MFRARAYTIESCYVGFAVGRSPSVGSFVVAVANGQVA
jgi:hypothetical protein